MHRLPDQPSGTPRRGFLARVGALAAGAVAALLPLMASALTALDPLLRRRSSSPGMVFITRLSAIPEGGVPRRFTIEAERIDAWTTHHSTPIGAVYLRRTDQGVLALNVVCPHAGCFVGLASDKTRFACPCHGSSFDLDGAINDPASPSPRDMDALEVELRNGEEVWVRYQNFLPGRATKEPLS